MQGKSERHVSARAAVTLELSAVEFEVLRLTAAGYSSQEAAVELRRGRETIKTHRKAIIAKLYARNMPHAIALACETWALAWAARELVLSRRRQAPA
jgi:DNA-binding CsgD family transcriptional regulator